MISHHTFVIGFSAGAFMTQRLAMEASDTFAAVVSVVGKLPASISGTREVLNGSYDMMEYLIATAVDGQ